MADPMTTKPGDFVLVYYAGFCIPIGVAVCGSEKRFKVADQVKFQGVFFIVVVE